MTNLLLKNVSNAYFLRALNMFYIYFFALVIYNNTQNILEVKDYFQNIICVRCTQF